MSKKRFIIRSLLFLGFAFILSSCSFIRPTVVSSYYPYRVLKSVPAGYTQVGIASWYGPKFQGRRTANGEIYNMYAHTAASKTLPFNTIVKVINLNNGRSTIVRINDRGPFVKNRIIDLSYAAARDLGMIGTGTAPVKIIVLGRAPSVEMFKNTSIAQKPFVSMKQLEKITIDTNIGVDGVDMDIGTDLSGGISKPSFAIQIGAFTNLFNALKFRDKVSKILGSSNVYVKSKWINGRKFYLVLIGNFDSKESASNYAITNLMGIVNKYFIIKK